MDGAVRVVRVVKLVKSVNPTPKQLGNMKTIKLTFSDRYTTQVARLPIMGLLVHIAMSTPITLDFLCSWIWP